MKAHVLIVDDEPLVLRVFSLLLRALGHEVTAVSSGFEALAALDRDSYDVVCLDQRMPGLTGVETWKRICACDRPTPVSMLVTAAADGADLAEAHGMLFLSKPFDLTALSAKLDEALARKSASAPSPR